MAFFFALEIQVERALAQLRHFRHIIHCCRRDALGEEHPFGGVYNVSAPLLSLSFPALLDAHTTLQTVSG
jgi:hypothetical protein